ncbi:MAG: hypothetical protein O7A71_08650, partial [Chloroflexi bacterium]|nr:hypothetical protein [Chloroflexota bacterium]
NSMQVTRLYSGSDGESHFEDIEVSLQEAGAGALSRQLPVESLFLRTTPTDYEPARHLAPRRQFIINLDGEVEIEAGATTRRFGPGTIIFAEDLTGRGHVTRDVGGARQSVVIPVPDDFDLDRLRS